MIQTIFAITFFLIGWGSIWLGLNQGIVEIFIWFLHERKGK